ncbi:MAG: PTS sugar transporter subunit IIC [Gemmatimonadota bacterium]|nr:PTS sugar transporter subunit IIC [Gemmatimonadota bacterium]
MTVPPVLFNVIPVALLGAIVGLDMVSFPQVMLSRPLVSATIAGAFVGRPSAGLLIGAVLELIALETLPFGASRYAEWGTAGVVGGVVMAAQPQGSAGALPVAMFVALATAVFSSQSMVWVRTWNALEAGRTRAAIDAGEPAAIDSVQLRGLTMDLLRGFGVTFVALVILLPLSEKIVAVWHGDAVHSRAVVTALAATVAAGAIWTLTHRAARAGWLFILGLVAGTLVLLLQ